MKKTLLLTFASALIYLSLVSYKNGPSAAGNRTGGPGSSGNTCTAGGCHGAASANTQIMLKLTDAATGVDVTDGKYAPLRTYTVELMVHGGTGFGFQAEVLDGSNNSVGVLTAGASQKVSTVAGKKLIEHSAPITGMTTTFTWVSPQAGAGPVTFYLVGNAVNMDNTTSGDVPSLPFSQQYTENNTSVGTVSNNISLVAFPNPTTDQLTVRLGNAVAGEYVFNAFSLNGAKLFENKIQVTGAQYETSIQTNTWPAGVYYVQIIKNGMKHVTTVVKQ